MPRYLFLRGQVPRDRDPKQIMFENLDDEDDMWTQLFASLAGDNRAEIWYWGGKRKRKYGQNLSVRWVKSLAKTSLDFEPDVVFARGGFPEYEPVLRRFRKARTIYYGAGRRFMPQHGFNAYNLILVDTPKQQKKVRSKFPKSRCELLIKPAADNIFRPVESEKTHDVIFVANEHPQGIKGHQFVLKDLPDDLKILQVGIRLKKRRMQHVDFMGWVPRNKLPAMYGRSKIAIVSAEKYDSCPRVIPEALACGCPLLATSGVKFWAEKYISPETGRICDRSEVVTTLREMIEHYDQFDAAGYYQRNLNLKLAAAHIHNLLP